MVAKGESMDKYTEPLHPTTAADGSHCRILQRGNKDNPTTMPTLCRARSNHVLEVNAANERKALPLLWYWRRAGKIPANIRTQLPKRPS
jgi:hypothetical protein